MDVELAKEFPAVSNELFLANYELGQLLAASKGSEVREFRDNCRLFLDSFVEHLLSLVYATSLVSRGLYCFCPELLLEGDDLAVLDLFGKLLRVLQECGYLTAEESIGAREEFATFVVDIRLSHKSSECRAEDIVDIVTYLSKSYILLQRRNLLRVFQLSCLVIFMPVGDAPTVDLDLSDCQLRPGLLSSCVRSVQSFALCQGYQQKSFFTNSTLDAVRRAIQNSTNFLRGSSFDPWGGVCRREKVDFVNRYSVLCADFVARKQKKQGVARKSSVKQVSFSSGNVAESSVIAKSPVVEASSSKTKPIKPAVIVRDESGEPMIPSGSGVKTFLQAKKKSGARMFTVDSPKLSRGRSLAASSSRGVPSSSSRGKGRVSVVQGASSGKSRKNKKSGEQDPSFTP